MNTTFQKKYGISAAVLKYIAVATMLVDHFALAVYRQTQGYNPAVYHAMRKLAVLHSRFIAFCLWKDFFIPKMYQSTLETAFFLQ